MNTQILPMKHPANPTVPRDYLLVARCGFDDIPLRLFKNTLFCRVLHEARGVTRDHVLKIAGEVFGLDTSEVVCLSIVQLSSSGVPVRCETVELQQEEGEGS